MSYTNNWVHGIRQTLTEGHSKAELEKLSNEKLKDLHKEYSGKDDDESKKEADMIKDILDSRGEDGEEKEEKTNTETVSEGKIKDSVKKVKKMIKKTTTRVGKALIADRDSAYLSRDIKP